MTKTPNYSLNQWDAGDKILHGDFNEDNRKLDAALAGMERKVKLKQVVMQEDANQFDVPLDDIDLSKYEKIIIEFQIIDQGGGFLNFQANGAEDSYHHGPVGNSYAQGGSSATIYAAGQYGFGTLELSGHFNGGNLIWQSVTYETSRAFVTLGYAEKSKYRDLKFVRFLVENGSNALHAPSYFRVYGVLPW